MGIMGDHIAELHTQQLVKFGLILGELEAREFSYAEERRKGIQNEALILAELMRSNSVLRFETEPRVYLSAGRWCFTLHVFRRTRCSDFVGF